MPCPSAFLDCFGAQGFGAWAALLWEFGLWVGKRQLLSATTLRQTGVFTVLVQQ